ncbi:MAG: DEAD/DEAH box helicase [Melioribacteraceae bacterium]|nr:DEAD/DEAH box helicase [Melioribacteraceae bacterium]
MNSFDVLNLDEELLKAVKDLGFENPTPVQEKVIPSMLESNKRDIIALAQTGTGKTAAFGLPIIQNVDASSKFTQCLILAPTRELCLQIADDLTSFAKYKSNITIAAVFGGASIEKQISMIKKGAQIISATPGRLLDLMNRNIIKLNKINTVVLDEADEMLNMGFREDLEEILSTTPSARNTLLFSATMPREVRAIANNYMKNPIEITIGKKNTGALTVSHECYMVQAKDRYLALKRIVDFYPDIYGIVFCRTRKETQDVADLLMRDGYNADAIHGDLSQAQRDTVMGKFRIKHIKLLVATDVAARGLDVENLTHIINYNLPDELEVYTHRSGRTGRAGKIGTSIVIANLKEKSKIQQIERMIDKKFDFKPIPSGKDICSQQVLHVVDRVEKVEVDYSQIEPFLPVIFKKLEWLDREELIRKFVSVEFNRFLDYYRNAPDLNVPVSSKSKRRTKDAITQQNMFTRFFINLGIKDSLKPVQLIGMINDFTNIRDIEIGAIDIMKNFSFFEADAAYSDLIIEGFKNKKLNEREINVEVAEKKKYGGDSGAGKFSREHGSRKGRSFKKARSLKSLNENNTRRKKKRR